MSINSVPSLTEKLEKILQKYVFVFDFDDVILRTNERKTMLFDEISRCIGVTNDKVALVYNQSKAQGGYDHVRFIGALLQIYPTTNYSGSTRKGLLAAFEATDKRSAELIQKNVVELMRTLRLKGCRVEILTASADLSNQIKKIDALRDALKDAFDEVTYCFEDGTGENKRRELVGIQSDNPSRRIVFFDDKLNNITSAAKIPSLISVHILAEDHTVSSHRNSIQRAKLDYEKVLKFLP